MPYRVWGKCTAYLQAKDNPPRGTEMYAFNDKTGKVFADVGTDEFYIPGKKLITFDDEILGDVIIRGGKKRAKKYAETILNDPDQWRVFELFPPAEDIRSECVIKYVVVE